MIYLGTLLFLLTLLYLYFAYKDTLENKKWLLVLGVSSFFLAVIASELGWVVAEVGRQPWAIQNLLPVKMATTKIVAGHVQGSFAIFFVLFAILLIAEIKIMLKQIKIGPEGV
jgi:cytochrome d ubiquinol oxidase subunit I